MLTGAILAGGKSLRYGTNKALVLFQGQTLISRAVESLRCFCDPVLIIANDLSPYYSLRATLIQDFIPYQGPLVGIYSALLFSPHTWVFIKATDMPFLVPGLQELMVSCIEGADIVVPEHNGRPEPLLALYSRRCLPSIAAVLGAGERKITSFYKRVKVKLLKEEEWRSVDGEGLSFKNVNTPENLDELLWI